jgi:hypothetical protein
VLTLPCYNLSQTYLPGKILDHEIENR